MSLTRQELEAFYAQLETPLYNFALRWTWSPALAQELVQEAFVRVWERKGRIDPKTLKPLLYKIVQNLAIGEYRKEQWRRRVRSLIHFADPPAESVEHEYAARQDWSALRQAIEALPVELRQALLLCEFSDLSYDQIAEIIGIPAGTVASRKNRAMQRLKEWEKGRK